MKRTSVNRNERPKPAYQPSEVFRVRTIALILSVTVLKVCPGAMTGGLPVPTTAAIGSSMLSGVLIGHPARDRSARSFAELRVHVANRSEIRRARPRVQLAEQRVLTLLGLELRD